MPTTTANADALAAAPAAALTRFAYVMTLQFPLGGMNHALIGDAGTLDIPADYGRHQAFLEIRQALINGARQQGITSEPSTLFFSIERDAL